tara:strand:- start:693 stop:1157 length:465 start_codon:yes stop_codon:yes gene_type:complete
MKNTTDLCCKKISSKKTWKFNTSENASFFTSILLILVPKCPYCILAYSSSILLFLDIETSPLIPIMSHFKPLLGGLTLLIIYFNYKGKKTIISLSLGSIAMIFLLISSYSSLLIFQDWLIYSIFIFSVWYNANFIFFKNFIFGNINRISKKIHL